MGMSNDYTIAVEEGATFIRIGTKLVGERVSPWLSRIYLIIFPNGR